MNSSAMQSTNGVISTLTEAATDAVTGVASAVGTVLEAVGLKQKPVNATYFGGRRHRRRTARRAARKAHKRSRRAATRRSRRMSRRSSRRRV